MYFARFVGSSSTPTMVPYIPGLPVESLLHHQKKAQKKKRKKKPAEPLEHRGSTSSETELPAPLQELHLTDDLADFMVNPPTEPECSDEETLSCSQEGLLPGLPRDPTLTFQDIPADGELAEEPAAPEEVTFPSSSPPEDTIPSSQPVAEEATLTVEEEPAPALVRHVQEAAVVEAAPALPDAKEVDVVAAPVPDSPPAGEETRAVDAAVPDLPVPNIPAVEEALVNEERCPSPCAEASCPIAAEVVVPHIPNDEPVKLPAPKQKKKPRSSRKTAVETTPLECQPASPPAAPTKSYSAVCRSGAEVPAAPPPARPASPQEVRAAAPPADQWENLPASLSASPERWQRKKDRKRKSKKSNLESSEEDRSEELPEPAVTETREEEVVAPPAPAKEYTPEVAGAGQEEPAAREEVEGEGEETRRSNKSVKRRRRKHTSEEPEEGHRVIICDNQVRFFSSCHFY
jgi:hypothetical protein